MEIKKKSNIPAKISTLPNAPGCYIFWDSAGDCLYVGKSKHVKNRVRSYFNKNALPKIRKLSQLIADIEYRPALSELDALYLEHALIKTYRPPFNSQMKKDPHPYYICIEWGWAVPGLYISDRPGPEATRYGSFFSGYDARDALIMLNRGWGTPICEKTHFAAACPQEGPTPRGCLNMHIGRCMGPCGQSSGGYRDKLLSVAGFMQGKNKQALRDLKHEMDQAAKDMNFEKAAKLRDALGALRNLQKRFTYHFQFPGRRLCVFMKGPHEPGFLLLYYKNGELRHVSQYIMDWPKTRDTFISVITGETRKDDNLPDLAKIYTPSATQEIRAKKCCVDVTRTRKEGLAKKLDRAFAKITPILS